MRYSRLIPHQGSMDSALVKDPSAPLGAVQSSTSNTALAAQVQKGPEQHKKSRRPTLDIDTVHANSTHQNDHVVDGPEIDLGHHTPQTSPFLDCSPFNKRFPSSSVLPLKTKDDKYESPVESEDIEIAKDGRAKALSGGDGRSAETRSKRKHSISPDSEKMDNKSHQLGEDEEECTSITKEAPLSLAPVGAQVEPGHFRRIQVRQKRAPQVAHSSSESFTRNGRKKQKVSKWSPSPSGSNLNDQGPSRTHLPPIDNDLDLAAAISLLHKVTAAYQNTITPLLMENEALRQSIKALEEKRKIDGEDIWSLRHESSRAQAKEYALQASKRMLLSKVKTLATFANAIANDTDVDVVD